MGSGTSPPPSGSKPKSAIPSHMLNGSSPLHVSTGSRHARERESLNSSILSSFTPRIPVEFDLPASAAHPSGESLSLVDDTPRGSSSKYAVSCMMISAHLLIAQFRPTLNDPPRDPRDEAGALTPPATVSRPASPYTLFPPIDFDGLSWPCK